MSQPYVEEINFPVLGTSSIHFIQLHTGPFEQENKLSCQ